MRDSFAAASVAASAALAATPAAAQTPVRESATHVLFGAGTDFTGGAPAHGVFPLAIHAGIERRVGVSRFGLRLEWEHWRDVRRFDGTLDGQVVPYVARTRTVYGASLLGTYQLVPSGGRFRPYLLGGAGLQQLSLRNETDWVAGPSNTGRKIVYAPPERRNGAALTLGAGTTVRLGASTLFLESRYTYLPTGRGAVPVRRALTPLTIGIKF